MVPLLTLASLLATGGEGSEPSATSSHPKVEILGPPVRGAVGIAGVGAYDFRFRTLGLVPLSAGFLVWSQASQGGGRNGIEVFLRAIPAVSLVGSAGGLGRGSFSPGPPFTIGGVVGFGYTWR